MNVIEEYKLTRQRLFDATGIQPQSKIVSTNGQVKNIHYLELGSGKPLILVHGGGGHSGDLISIMKPLAEHFHLYVVDRPGCGLSDTINYRGIDVAKSAVDFIRSFMDAVGLRKALLGGNSMGGTFCVYFALQYPERVEKLLLISYSAGMTTEAPLMLRLLSIRGLNSFLSATVGKPTIKNIVTMYKQILVADISKLTDDYLQNKRYSSLISGTDDAFLTMAESVLNLKGFKKKFYIGDKLGQLKMPVRFVWGEKDVFQSPDSGLKIAKTIKDYKFEVVENAGHMPWLDQPEKCSKLLIKVLEE
jgi:pimeloyl-ACP methyl ester carboxylesterase